MDKEGAGGWVGRGGVTLMGTRHLATGLSELSLFYPLWNSSNGSISHVSFPFIFSLLKDIWQKNVHLILSSVFKSMSNMSQYFPNLLWWLQKGNQTVLLFLQQAKPLSRLYQALMVPPFFTVCFFCCLLLDDGDKSDRSATINRSEGFWLFLEWAYYFFYMSNIYCYDGL